MESLIADLIADHSIFLTLSPTFLLLKGEIELGFLFDVLTFTSVQRSFFHKTLKRIFGGRSLNYYVSAVGNHDLPFNYQFEKSHSIYNHCE